MSAQNQSISPSVFSVLAQDYPVLFLDPDRDDGETYRQVMLRGIVPTNASLAHYRGDPHDRLETADTPAGKVRIVTLGNRRDFELVLRGLMAARDGPRAEVPAYLGASTLTTFNWRRIREHLAAFPEAERPAEFKRFIFVGDNYRDQLVLLSRGPYSHVEAAAVGHSEEEWTKLSDTIRRYHELTHVICRRLYPENIEALRDELIADAMGLYAAYGRYDADKARLFLGLRGGKYIGGRMEHYTNEPERLAAPVDAALERIQRLLDACPSAEPFDLIPLLLREECTLKENIAVLQKGCL